MSTAWIWAGWVVAIVAVAFYLVAFADFGNLEPVILVAAGLVLAAGAMWLENSQRPSMATRRTGSHP